MTTTRRAARAKASEARIEPIGVVDRVEWMRLRHLTPGPYYHADRTNEGPIPRVAGGPLVRQRPIPHATGGPLVQRPIPDAAEGPLVCESGAPIPDVAEGRPAHLSEVPGPRGTGGGPRPSRTPIPHAAEGRPALVTEVPTPRDNGTAPHSSSGPSPQLFAEAVPTPAGAADPPAVEGRISRRQSTPVQAGVHLR